MCSRSVAREIWLPSEPRAAAAARVFMREILVAPRLARALEEAELLVSELVTNAVRYGTPPVRLRTEFDGDTVQVWVTDSEPTHPEALDVAWDAESGRGVRLVDVISDRWGVDDHVSDGKSVWFTLVV